VVTNSSRGADQNRLRLIKRRWSIKPEASSFK